MLMGTVNLRRRQANGGRQKDDACAGYHEINPIHGKPMIGSVIRSGMGRRTFAPVPDVPYAPRR